MSLDVRLSREERAAIRRRAQVLGIKPSVWARAAMLDALDPRRRNVERLHEAAAQTPQPERAGAVEQLRRVGKNLWQAMRCENVTVDDALLREVLAAVDEVRASFGDGTSQ